MEEFGLPWDHIMERVNSSCIDWCELLGGKGTDTMTWRIKS